MGRTVTENTLTVKGGTLTEAAYGGLVENYKIDPGTHQPLTTGDAKKNRLVIEGGSIKDAYGAKVATKDGSAEENTVDITGGSVTGSVYGGALTMAGATGSANKNTINLKANVTGDIYGGFTAGTGKTAQNTVTIGDGETALNLTFAGILHGGNSTAVPLRFHRGKTCYRR